MDSPDRPSNFMGTTIIDVDIDSANNGNTDLPVWLREVLDRALTASGFKSKRKVASDEAIENLTEVDLSKLEDKDCPICFDPYESPKTRSSKGPNIRYEQDSQKNESDYKLLLSTNSALIDKLKITYGISNIQSLEQSNQFNDPSLFLPVDEGTMHYSRFPIRNLSTLEETTLEQLLPGYVDEEKAKQEKSDKMKSEGHVPTKMPNCGHIFGRSCIIEWLKSNVSCPLCRKEVEASKETDPKEVKMNEIRNNSFYNFNVDQDAVVDHIANHSTDVFSPFRRPFNPVITPLTDSFMHQNWATPYNDDNSIRVNAREPNLVLPRRFPFPETSVHPFPFPYRSRVRDLRRETRRSDNTNTEGDASNNNRDSNRPLSRDTISPFSILNRLNREPRGALQDNDPDANQNLSQDTQSNNSSSSLNLSGSGRGGPERSRRTNPSGGRTHPYSRPSTEE